MERKRGAMRRTVIRDIIDAVDREMRKEGPHPERVERSADLAACLELRIRDTVVDFLAEHDLSDADQFTVCQALLGAAAVQVMTIYDMDPDNFAELAREMGRLSLPEVAELKARLRRTGMA